MCTWPVSCQELKLCCTFVLPACFHFHYHWSKFPAQLVPLSPFTASSGIPAVMTQTSLRQLFSVLIRNGKVPWESLVKSQSWAPPRPPPAQSPREPAGCHSCHLTQQWKKSRARTAVKIATMSCSRHHHCLPSLGGGSFIIPLPLKGLRRAPFERSSELDL